MKQLLGFVTWIAFSSPCWAQDYPYDDTELKKDEKSLPNEKAAAEEVDRGGKRRLPALARLGIKGGGNFTLFQNPSGVDPTLTTQFSGFGAEGLISVGWDLPYQPVYLELESGYKALLLSAQNTLGESIPPLHVIPLSFGVFLRNRIGKRSMWKPGIRGTLEMRISDDVDPFTGETVSAFGVFPTVSIGSILELGSFLVEPSFTIGRLQKQFVFFSFAVRSGFRF